MGTSSISIAGGGDIVSAIAKYGIECQVDYISTGGGAFLEVLEGKTLPAFEILQKRAVSKNIYAPFLGATYARIYWPNRIFHTLKGIKNQFF